MDWIKEFGKYGVVSLILGYFVFQDYESRKEDRQVRSEQSAVYSVAMERLERMKGIQDRHSLELALADYRLRRLEDEDTTD